MKTLKFKEHLSKLILEGKKDNTWRIFDDKDLKAGDNVTFLVAETKEEFAKALLTSVKEKTFDKLNEKDKEGHENFDSESKMYETYSKFYNTKVDKNTKIKIIRFELI